MKIFPVVALIILAVQCGSADADNLSSLTVISSTFGAGSVQRDVSELVRAKIKSDCLNFSANSGDLGGDPVFGKVKTLQIKYSFKGHVYDQSFSEGQRVVLPNGKEASVVMGSAVPISSPVVAQNSAATLPVASALVTDTPSPVSSAPIQYVAPANAGDWTVNGREYHNVKVGEVEIDRVHITYDGGLGTVMIADLPPELKKCFVNYDPAAAKAKMQERQAVAAASDAVVAEVQAEKAKDDEAQAQHNQRVKEIAKNPCYIMGSVLQKIARTVRGASGGR